MICLYVILLSSCFLPLAIISLTSVRESGLEVGLILGLGEKYVHRGVIPHSLVFIHPEGVFQHRPPTPDNHQIIMLTRARESGLALGLGMKHVHRGIIPQSISLLHTEDVLQHRPLGPVDHQIIMLT